MVRPLCDSPEAEIRGRIARRGRIPFAEFMEVALYHPCGGYYAGSTPVGTAGDYFTSPAAHPAFGALIAIQFQRMWELLERPVRFDVVEMGAGGGLLARAVTDYASRMSGAFAHALRYTAMERRWSPEDSGTAGERIHWTTAGAEAIPFRDVVGCFISNELLDSFPVHRFQIHRGAVQEVYVALNAQGSFVEVMGEPSTPLLAQRLGELGFPLPEGFQGEVRLNVAPWVRQVSDSLKRGFVITIDYGYEAKDLYSSSRAAGTLRTYYRHTWGGNLYERIGRQDLTAHVDLSQVSSEGEALGLKVLALLTQATFLRRLGLGRMVQRLRGMKLDQHQRGANMMAMLELAKPEGLGGFRVLIQERGTGVRDGEHLVPGVAPEEEIEVPLLGPQHVPLLEGRYPHLVPEVDELWPFEGYTPPETEVGDSRRNSS